MSKYLERIRKLENNQKLLSENSIDAIWVLDAETLKFEYITESIKKISGYRADEYINRSASERLTAPSIKKIIDILKEELPKFEKGIKKSKTMEVQLIHKNGTKYWSVIKAKFFTEPSGKRKIFGVTREISELKRLQIQKEKLANKLKRMSSDYEKILNENEILKHLIPMCSKCNKYCDANGDWWDLNKIALYFKNKTANESLCNNCRQSE